MGLHLYLLCRKWAPHRTIATASVFSSSSSSYYYTIILHLFFTTLLLVSYRNTTLGSVVLHLEMNCPLFLYVPKPYVHKNHWMLRTGVEEQEKKRKGEEPRWRGEAPNTNNNTRYLEGKTILRSRMERRFAKNTFHRVNGTTRRITLLWYRAAATSAVGKNERSAATAEAAAVATRSHSLVSSTWNKRNRHSRHIRSPASSSARCWKHPAGPSLPVCTVSTVTGPTYRRHSTAPTASHRRSFGTSPLHL